MKKFISIILIISILFSISSVTLTANAQVISSDNYAEVINEKVKDENFFVKFIAKLIILGIKLRLVSLDKLIELCNSTSTETKNTTNNTPISPQPNEEILDNTLKLHHSQSLPYESKGIAITDISISKEKYDDIRGSDYNQVQKYRYVIKINGCAIDPNICQYTNLYIQFFSENEDGSELRYYLLRNGDNSDNIDASFIIDENGNFEFECYQYNIFFDYDTYYIAQIELMP